ncbi:cation:proton antiporter domain-containing protein [Pinibacter aurantiacus]|nr:cation:proton antiporter [Pinibacter aurantiacus]
MSSNIEWYLEVETLSQVSFMRKLSLLFYTLVVAFCGTAIYFIAQFGTKLQKAGLNHAHKPVSGNSFGLFTDSLHHSLTHPSAILLLQIITIVVVARAFGFIFNKIGQPAVIGEIIAGIVLGPSVLGLFFPGISGFLFPAASLGNLNFLSQIGLMLFMFVIGMELDVNHIRKQAKDAVVISHASIIIPYTLGMGLACVLYTQFAPTSISFLSFALFLGIAMSITAFPVLARIIQERGLTKTKLGTMALTCAAADDVTAWCILAAVIAIVKAGTFVTALYTIALAIAYVLFMLMVLKPFLNRLGSIYAGREMVSKAVMAFVFMILLGSAYATEVIGIHALFGAFLAGVIMPDNFNFRKIVTDKVEDISIVLLLPLFFVLTGLRTQIGLLNTAELWLICGGITLVAVVGKFGGSAFAARIMGQSWRDSLAIGALMNTRGLMELVVLNIGYDLGILSPQVFAMMVLMAIITTFMTGPALDLLNRSDRRRAKTASAVVPDNHHAFKILLSFDAAESGRKLLQLAAQLMGKKQLNNQITAINLTYNPDITTAQIDEFEKESFSHIRDEAKKMKVQLDTRYQPVIDVRREIIKIAEDEHYDFMLVDAGKSLLKGTFLGNLFHATKVLYPENLLKTITGDKKLMPQLLPTNDMIDQKAAMFIEEAKCSIGVFIDKDYHNSKDIFMPIFHPSDESLLRYARKFIQNNQSKLVVLDALSNVHQNERWDREVAEIRNEYPASIELATDRTINKSLLSKFSLMLISYDSWNTLAASKSVWLEHIPSVLIIKHVAAAEPVEVSVGAVGNMLTV